MIRKTTIYVARSNRISLFSGLFSLFVLGCSGPKYVLDTSEVPFSQLLDNLQDQQEKIHSLEASSRISVDSQEFSGNFFADIAYLHPDSLLISATGPFGIQAGTLFIGKNRFIFLNRMSNKFYNGSVEDFKDRNFFQFPLRLSELMDIFAARESLSALQIHDYEIRDDRFFIYAQRGSLEYEIWIDPVTGRMEKITASSEGRTLYIREYSDFIKVQDLYFPRKIVMTRPEALQSVAVYYQRIAVNKNIDRSKFLIEISDQAEQIDFSNFNGN